ncbi:helix-turn-helix domain-containing protein [Sedimentimonas flavescens]|uniref:Helix-turn-helix domain-containing protein n=1 Tax=Sedimentimonas flavescens TaxID=2851012 RepID=A0ABT2ZZG8_9RHOB|nr:helix-turn-helix domain-containing protein [Sedimentimonas flavescens]MCT2541041.1 helix-turn-helix domain-containing protein [Sedimentimonas flavescens]MCV2879100.1 helix-turn-helix domain-containing protein [Sedimentimonas flavescens]WBL33045.1 helix-turn-helix domain-containing protein [Sinirhodobacter sp. HNIBRBA609]
MPDNISSVTEGLRTGNRAVIWGIAAIATILAVAAALLFLSLPDANAFNTRVERIFVENDALTSPGEIKLLEVLAQSGTAFAEVLSSYRVIIFILLVFATALMIAALVLLVIFVSLNRRMSEIQRAGIEVQRLRILRGENAVMLNDMAFTLTPAAIETLAVLAEARMDDDILTGAQIEAVISGRPEADCDEAAGATRIKRLRDALGNQLVAELLVRNISRKGYTLTVAKEAIRVD